MAPQSEPPLPNSYWLPGGYLIAGEYPGSLDIDETRTRIGALLDAGVRAFIDLTEEGELMPYDAILVDEARARNIDITHTRISIRDVRTPAPGVMEQILKAIDVARAEGRVGYVHCWGGIGRTGTVMGCHLVEQGHSCEEALAIVQSLYDGMEKRRRGRSYHLSPETDAQRRFVEQWKPRAE